MKEWANVGKRDLQTLRHIFEDLGHSEESCFGVFNNRCFYWMAYTKACEGDFGTVDSDLGGRNRQRSYEILPVQFCVVSKCGYSSMELHKRKSNLKKKKKKKQRKPATLNYLHGF